MDPIHDTIERWHSLLRDGEFDRLDDLLHEDCVFYSPVLFAPQEGRELTAMYLTAAFQVFPGDERFDAGGSDLGGIGGFRYVKQILDDRWATLEFETRMGAVEVNGIDLITCDDDGKIVEFKVMIRPHRAVDAVRERMAAMLATMNQD